jgi:hypothetical protein
MCLTRCNFITDITFMIHEFKMLNLSLYIFIDRSGFVFLIVVSTLILRHYIT